MGFPGDWGLRGESLWRAVPRRGGLPCDAGKTVRKRLAVDRFGQEHVHAGVEDMATSGVDILISAPQKGWTGSPCCGLVMLSERARARIEETTSSSFACDLKKWLQIMEAYEQGGHAYHATMPTDGLRILRNVMQETLEAGLEETRAGLLTLGGRVRQALTERGYPSVAAAGYQAPGVVVSYTGDPGIKNGSRFAAQGLQIAPGVPLMCDEPADFSTFRIGLFGLDKLADIDRTVASLERALDEL